MKNSIISYFDKSLLSVADREIVSEELLANSSVVSKALEPHFSITGKVFTDKWVDTEFKGAKTEIKLHGQLDSVIDNDKKVLVFDYKTKEGMSENAIKGLTKNDDGNYWRQLIFYKILLDGNTSFSQKQIEPALVFVKPDDKGRCPTITLSIIKEDTERVKKEINTLLESVYSGSFLLETCDDKDCEWCSLKKHSIY